MTRVLQSVPLLPKYPKLINIIIIIIVVITITISINAKLWPVFR